MEQYIADLSRNEEIRDLADQLAKIRDEVRDERYRRGEAHARMDCECHLCNGWRGLAEAEFYLRKESHS